jgi:5-methylcytosine-specific restriction endonuclease McrA
MRFDPRVCLRAGSGWGGYADGEPELPPVPPGVLLAAPQLLLSGMTDILRSPTVLVLNRHWQAIDVKTPAEAFGMMATGSASGLDITGEGMRPVGWKEWLTLPVREHDLPVRTVRGSVRAPTVLVLARFARMPRRRLSFSLRGLWERDGGICQYTGRQLQPGEGNIDHVVPRSRGGASNWENCVLACKRVNQRKGDRTPDEAGLQLLRAPVPPRELPASAFIRNTHGIRDWEAFLAS